MASMKYSLSHPDNEFERQYCSLCDKYFWSKAMLREHLESNPQVHPRCGDCKMSFLNMNSLRSHWVISSRHNYCRSCEKFFETAEGFRVHLEHALPHREDFDADDDPESYDPSAEPAGWEDQMAAELERQRYKEDPVVAEDSEPTMSRVQATKAILVMKRKLANNKMKQPKKIAQSCPICLATPKSMSAAQCGHMFCTSCIRHAFENNQGCPTCRRPGRIPQLRKVGLCVSA